MYGVSSDFLLGVIVIVLIYMLSVKTVEGTLLLYLLLAVFVVVSLFLIFGMAILDRNIRGKTRFMISKKEIISLVGNKKKTTTINKNLTVKVWRGIQTCTIGFNIGNQSEYELFNPVIEYSLWFFLLYTHFFYDIEEDGKNVVQIIDELKKYV